MSKYRIVSVPMYKLIGEYYFHGYTKAYDIQKRTWYGSWKTLESGPFLTLDYAKAVLSKLKSGSLVEDGEVVYEE